jgi:hypothetical protein
MRRLYRAVSSARDGADRPVAERIENTLVLRYSGATFSSEAWQDTEALFRIILPCKVRDISGEGSSTRGSAW